jgi:hypothetical protein
MGFAQERHALAVQFELTPGQPTPQILKHVLQVLAFRACQKCGHARPGTTQIALDTGLHERSVREALVALRRRPELLKVYRYGKGGRAVTTEYVVIPHLAAVIPTECPDWDRHDNTRRRAQGLTRTGRLNPAPEDTETRSRGTYHPSVHPHPSGSLRSQAVPDGPAVEPRNTPPPRSDHQTPTTPSMASEAVAAVTAMLRRRTRAAPSGEEPGSHRSP